MSQYEKLLLALLSGTQDRNFLFSDLQLILESLGFRCRIKGDHFIYTREGVEEIINIQPVNGRAKPYQVKQVRQIVLKYHLGVSYMKYETIIYWSVEDAAYIAEVPELPGCMADGKTAQDALHNVERIAAEWIETATELGRDIPAPKGRLQYA